MRILFDSKQLTFKDPFGTLVPDQTCTLNIHVPATVQAVGVTCVFQRENGAPAWEFPMEYKIKKGAYDIFQGKFSLPETGLFFYYFRISKKTGLFRLFKAGNDTNMESGDCWQLSCVPASFTTPDWAKGATIYQVFPTVFTNPVSATSQANWAPIPSMKTGMMRWTGGQPRRVWC